MQLLCSSYHDFILYLSTIISFYIYIIINNNNNNIIINPTILKANLNKIISSLKVSPNTTINIGIIIGDSINSNKIARIIPIIF